MDRTVGFLGFIFDVGGLMANLAVIPWGRVVDIRQDLRDGAKSQAEGGTGMADIWYEWCLKNVAPYMES